MVDFDRLNSCQTYNNQQQTPVSNRTTWITLKRSENRRDFV